MAGFFYRDLVTRREDGVEGPTISVFRQIVYHVDILRMCKVPVGFNSDLASIPRFLWPILPPTGVYDKAAILHDYLYRRGVVYKLNQGPYRPKREEADKIFYSAMKSLDVPWWKRKLMYHSVRAFGSKYYKKDLV